VITDALHKIAHHRHSLSREEARQVMSEILSGKTTDAQIAALLVALHMKGETVEEIVGFAEAIRAVATPIANANGTALDVSGTDREALIRRLLEDQYSHPVRIIAFNTTEGWSRDVTVDIGDELRRRYPEYDEVPDSVQEFLATAGRR